ncbi:hypothetical protein [Actinomadura flavalba]|uniref:hypothetical protein n=1 Tax=Actinomadura flavalba TaxID=1120938 RepID=UPI00036FC513|nr:hypothetical protein [Actinomadura flavalba]
MPDARKPRYDFGTLPLALFFLGAAAYFLYTGVTGTLPFPLLETVLTTVAALALTLTFRALTWRRRH